MNKRKLFYALPPAIRLLVRQMYYLPKDTWDSIHTNRNDMVPPKGMIYTGGGDFIETGERFLKYFIEYGQLHHNSKVLDVGSGIGRMAIPLTNYLTKEGRYEGFDVVKKGVKWCQNKISSKYPNFSFKFIDLSNDLYKSAGEDPVAFKFPYPQNHFDLVILISVFTHMSKDEVMHYLDEIYNTLHTGGRCFTTFFTYDDKTKPTKNNFSFKYKYEHYSLMNKDVTSANIAFDFDYLRSEIINKGFKIELYNKGKWQVNNDDSLDFQDVIVLSKP